jgi:WD40 repeat protein
MAADGGFYVTGGTLGRDAACYVVRAADDRLFEGLRSGHFCYVLTARQMGKSSLMVRTAVRLREAGAGVAVLDLTALGQNLTAEQWYSGLLAQMGQQLDLVDELEDFWDAHREIGPLQRWARAIRDVVLPRHPGQVVVFVDEIDAVRSLPFSTDELFAAIREFYNRRTQDESLGRLTFCLLGVAAPSDLIRDTRTTPFNVGTRIELDDFTAAEAGVLAAGLGRTELLERVLHWTGGHPYLTQRLCQAAAGDEAASAADVDRLCEELYLTRRARERDDNLLFVRERMLRSEVDLAGLLSLYDRVLRGQRVEEDEASPLVTVLRLSGVVRARDGALGERNRIYARVFDREWVRQAMPDAEVRRQRAAYRKGLLRAGALATVVVAAIGALALAAVHQRNRAEEQERANYRLLYAAEMNLAAQAWQDAKVSRVRELLERHLPTEEREDLRGFEWYYLWRASHGEARALDTKWIYALAYSPDGRYVATAGEGVTLWDPATGAEVRTLVGPDVGVASVAFSPDGTRLAATDAAGPTKVFDVETGRELATLAGRPGARVLSVAFSPDGRRVATGSFDRTATVWDAASGAALLVLEGHGHTVNAVAFAPDGATLATGSADATVRLWDAATGRLRTTLAGHAGAIVSIAISADGKWLAAGATASKADVDEQDLARATTIEVWDLRTGEEVPHLPGHRGVGGVSTAIRRLAFSPDGKMLATGSFDSTVKIWATGTWRELTTIKGHGTTVYDAAFSPDGRWLATGSMEGAVKLWDLSAGAGPASLTDGASDTFLTVAYAPDGRTVVGANWVGDLVVWDAVTGRKVTTLETHARRGSSQVLGMVFSPDGATLAAASSDGTLRLWDAAAWSARTLEAAPDGGGASQACVAFSRDGSRLAFGGPDGAVQIYETAGWLAALTIPAQPGLQLAAVAFSPDGQRICTAYVSGTLKMWDGGDAREVVSVDLPMSLMAAVYAPDGETIAVGGYERTARLLDARTGREVAVLAGHPGEIFSLAFSPDGTRLVASGGGFEGITLWDVATRRELGVFREHKRPVMCVAFSPDGRSLATAGADGAVKLWRAATEEDVLAQGPDVRQDVTSPRSE